MSTFDLVDDVRFFHLTQMIASSIVKKRKLSMMGTNGG